MVDVDPSPWQHFQWSSATDLPLGMAASECCTSGRKRHFFNSTLHLPSENCDVQRNTADVEEKCCPIPKSIESIAILNGMQHHAIKHAAYFAGILLDWCALKEISLHDLHEKLLRCKTNAFLARQSTDLHLSNNYFAFQKNEASLQLHTWRSAKMQNV